MKTLQVLRHAKSSRDDPGLDDHDRPLAARGRKACKRMAPALRDGPALLGHIFCSTALRARQTIERIARAIPETPVRWQADAKLYTFSADALLAWCRKLDDAVDDVLVVGHNPALTDLCNRLGDRELNNIPTCGFVRLELPISHWRDAGKRRGITSAVLVPKELPRR